MKCPRELWLTYVAIIFEYIGLYSFMSVLSLWLTSDFRFDDDRASGWFGVFSALLSLFAFMVGSIADVVGTRRTLIFSFGAAMLTRAVMSVSPSAVIALPALIAYAFALASGSPVLQTAVHKYSNKRTVAIAFSFFYIALNVGGVLSGQLIDRTKAFFVDPATRHLVMRTIELPLVGATPMSAYRAIIGLGTITAMFAFVATLFVRSDAALERAGVASRPEAPGEGGVKKSPLAVLGEVVRDRAFWRFMLLIAFLVLVKAIFVHMHATWPKFITRERGEDFDWGGLWALNSVLILFFVPVTTAFTRHLPALQGHRDRGLRHRGEPLHLRARLVDGHPGGGDRRAHHRRGALVAAQLRVQRLHRAAGPRGDLREPRGAAVLPREVLRRHDRLACSPRTARPPGRVTRA